MSTPEQVAAAFSPAVFDDVVRPLLGDVALDATQIAQEEAPEGERDVEIGPLGENSREPGALKKSLEPFEDPSTWSAGVRTDDPIAAMIQYGTAAHEIAPKHLTAGGAPGFLAFTAGGHTIFTNKPIQHPGTQANPFLDRTLERMEPRLMELTELIGAGIIGRID